MTPPNPTLMLPFLRKLEALSSLSAEEREAFLGLPFSVVEVLPNRDFIRQSERVTHSCFVVEGVVASFKQDREGNRQIVSIFIDGDMADLHSAVVPETLSAFSALTQSKILQVPHSAIRQIAKDYPNLGEALWRHCVVDAGILMEWVVNVGRRDAKTRLAHFFCELACRAAPSGPRDGTTIPYPITQSHLSDILSMTPVHVNRTMQAIRQEHLLENMGRSIQRVVNWNGLMRIGDFDPFYLHLNGSPQIRVAA